VKSSFQDAARGAVGQGTKQRLMPLNNLAEGLAAASQASRDQISIVEFGGTDSLEWHHITAYVTEKVP
jgi:hypothetical protein